MRHLYWIICGVVLVALLATWFLVVPTDVARASKLKLDQQSKDLKELETRAARGDPQGVFDAEDADDTKRLASEYLITESWKGRLQPHVEKYQKQLTDIKAQLLGRAAYLHKAVTPTTNVLEWYSAYIAASEALIGKLREANCMKRAATDEVVNANGESPVTVRNSVGLYTKSGPFPDPREHAQLTVRLRAMELIASRLIAGRVAVADSPVVGPTGPPEDRTNASALIYAVEWVGSGGGSTPAADGGLRLITTPINDQTQARSLGLRLTLTGPLSTLLAASAALERNAETDRPLIAVTSATLSRRETTTAGERYDVADDIARIILAVEVIEFVEPTSATSGETAGAAGLPGSGPPSSSYPGGR